MSDKPMPLVTPTSAPFWEGLARARIMLQRCCGRWIFYPRTLCPRCGAAEPPWQAYDGSPTLYSFTVAHAPVSPDFAGEGPAILAIVALEPGVHMPSTIVETAIDDVRIGATLEPVYDNDSFGGLTVLRFRIAVSG